VDYRDLEAGDVITFMLDEDTVATHRIVEVAADETDPAVLRFRTKGDANDAVDGGLVHFKNVIGSPVFTIPGLGYAANYIQNPPGTYIAISAGAILILLVFLPDLFGKEEEGKRKRPSARNAGEEAAPRPARTRNASPQGAPPPRPQGRLRLPHSARRTRRKTNPAQTTRLEQSARPGCFPGSAVIIQLSFSKPLKPPEIICRRKLHENEKQSVASHLWCGAACCGSVFGTLAYLTATDTVTNTFTVGKVQITLDEAPVDANGETTDGDRVKKNNYHLLPGHEYDKDPIHRPLPAQ